MSRSVALTALVALAGCDRILGVRELQQPDARGPLRLAGGVQGTLGGGAPSPVPFASLTFDTNNTSFATTSSSSGAFELEVPNIFGSGFMFEGHMIAELPTGPLRRTTHFLPRPANDDDSLVIQMFDAPTIAQLASLYGEAQAPDATAVFVQAVEFGRPAEGVSIFVLFSNLPVHYDLNGVPNATAAQTDPNGRAYVFNVPDRAEIRLLGLRPGSGFSSDTVFGPARPFMVDRNTHYFVTLNQLD